MAVALIVILLLASALPITGEFKFFVVESGSMEPAVHTGSVIMVKPEKDYNIGDIITFGPNNRVSTPTTHRIIEKKEKQGVTTFVTKGDANDGPDMNEVNENEVIGKLIFKVPFVGYAVAVMKRPYGFLAIIIIPAAVIVVDEIAKIVKEVKNARKKNDTTKDES